MSRKLILYIATSVDGYIAGPEDDLGFLSIVEKPGEDYGYGAFIDTVDTVILGRRTYDWVMKHVTAFPHADKESYIITRTPRPSIGNIHFYTGDLTALVNRLKQEEGKNIFCDGGAEVVHALVKENLIDEFIISIVPVLLGNGTRLFKDGRPMLEMELKSSRSFDTGLTQIHYIRKN
ncbi:MAG TPA: dihydrofolate reductase family protein [Saprospiraceae bacterium]|nr:dihydrofolate reductase family protein [Saprospiraceae bacterium]